MGGEYAEMMLDGTCCAGCGEFLDSEPMGFPQYCASCRRGQDVWQTKKPKGKVHRRDSPCPHCGRRFRGVTGLAMHQKERHP